jgi:hypothetical protein
MRQADHPIGMMIAAARSATVAASTLDPTAVHFRE